MDGQQRQDPYTFDDVLNQLAKPTILKSPQIQESGGSSFSQGKPDTIKPAPVLGGGFKLPELSKKPDISAGSVAGGQLYEPGRQLVGLSIRTMADDIRRLKEGLIPTGTSLVKPASVVEKDLSSSGHVALSEKSEKMSDLGQEVIQTSEIGNVPESAPVKIPPMNRPALPASQAPAVSLPPLTSPKLPGLNQKTGVNMIPGNEEKVEYKVIAKVVSSGMTTGILGTVAVAIAVYYALTLFVFNVEEVDISTPTPSVSVSTPVKTPELSELENIFGNIEISVLSLSGSDPNPLSSFRSFINYQALDKKEFKRVSVLVSDEQILKPNLTQLLGIFSLPFPQELSKLIKNNSVMLLYGQQEAFDNQGQVEVMSQASKKIVFIAEVVESPTVFESMKLWEESLQNDLRAVLEVDSSKEASRAFLDNSYRGVKIRYKNFPYPDTSIDYAVITSLSGRYYLIISNSRESMYSPIDRIMGTR